jgi:pilus assembly protein Flp/PilA
MGSIQGEGHRGNLNTEEVRRMLFLPREEGQGLVEYALILVLVAIVVIVILAILGPAIGNVFSNIVNAV